MTSTTADPGSQRQGQPAMAPGTWTPAVAGPRVGPAALPAGWHASAQLDPCPAAAAQARGITRDYLRRWDLQALTEDAETVASELVANAVAAVPPGTAGLALIFSVHARPPEVRIETWDIGPGKPDQAAAGDDAENGRGLAIIDALTGHNWGWWPTPASGGKVVHATLTSARPA